MLTVRHESKQLPAIALTGVKVTSVGESSYLEFLVVP